MRTSKLNPKVKIIILFLLFQFTNGEYLHKFPTSKLDTDSSIDVSNGNDVKARWKLIEAAIKNSITTISKPFVPVALKVFPSINISQNCSMGLMEYFRGLIEMKHWAFAMVDASGRLPAGIFSGTASALGDFDGCLNITAPKFRGKYCLLDFYAPLPDRESLQPLNKGVPELPTDFEPGSIMEYFAQHAPYYYSSPLRSSICLPSVCSKNEVQLLASKVFGAAKLGMDVVVPYCEETVDQIVFTSGEIAIIILLCTLLSIVIVGTAFDIYYQLNPINELECPKKKQSTLLKCIMCFSAYSNLIRLLTYEKTPEALSVFHGLRVILMLWIILCHTYFTVNFLIHDGLFNANAMMKELKFQPIINGFVSVDGFFFMSSVLVVYGCMRLRGRLSVLLLFLKRYYRISIPLILVTSCFSIVDHFGSGPFWRESIIDNFSSQCRESGWFNLLYINNYFYSNDTCMGWTWYLSADTQLFAVCLYVIVLLRRSPKRGFRAICFLLVAGIASTAFSHVYYNLPPTYLNNFMNSGDWFYYASRGHTPAHIHLSTSCIGMSVGYILATQNVRIPKRINVMGWVISISVMWCVIHGTYYWNQGHIPSMFVSALYGSTHRIIWSLCLGFITISCSVGYGGVIYNFLSWGGFVPLARLTYMAYLTHSGIIYIFMASTRSTITYSHRSLLLLYCGFVVVTFTISCILSLIFESPFMALEKVLSKRPKLEKPFHVLNT